MVGHTTGIRATLSGVDVRSHLIQRATHHRHNAAQWEAVRERWLRMDKSGDLSVTMAEFAYGKADENARLNAAQERSLAELYDFMATHLRGDEFELTMQDAVAYEFVPSPDTMRLDQSLALAQMVLRDLEIKEAEKKRAEGGLQ